jgi:hypothetical protein
MINHNKVKRRTLALILKDEKDIVIDNTLIKKVLGFDDMRDFVKEIGDWGHVTDFTYQTEPEDWQSFLRRFLQENFLD